MAKFSKVTFAPTATPVFSSTLIVARPLTPSPLRIPLRPPPLRMGPVYGYLTFLSFTETFRSAVPEREPKGRTATTRIFYDFWGARSHPRNAFPSRAVRHW